MGSRQHARVLVYGLAGNEWMETNPHGDDAFADFSCRDLSPFTSSLSSNGLFKFEISQNG